MKPRIKKILKIVHTNLELGSIIKISEVVNYNMQNEIFITEYSYTPTLNVTFLCVHFIFRSFCVYFSFIQIQLNHSMCTFVKCMDVIISCKIDQCIHIVWNVCVKTINII